MDARKPPVVRFTSTRGRFSIYAGLQCPQATPCPRQFTIPAGGSPSAPVYDSHDRLSRLHRLTTPRPTHLAVPSLKLRSSLSSVSRGLVYINIPGRTCLHELFIEYEQVTAWVARFSFNKMEANYHILSTTVYTGWLKGHAHKSLPLQFG